MLESTFAIEILIMTAGPIGLWLFLRRRIGATWSVIGIGALTFVLSQVVHLPLLRGLTWALDRPGVWPYAPNSIQTILFNATVLGLAAGVCEEVARYLVLRHGLKDARSWNAGVAFGAGHGGVEAILLGTMVFATFTNMLALRQTDLAALGVTSDRLIEVESQIAAYWAIPWYLPLLGALERAMAITMHIAWSLLVMQALTRRNLGWLALAIAAHAVVDGVAVGLSQAGVAPLAIEGVLLLFTLGAVGVIVALHRQMVGDDVSRET